MPSAYDNDLCPSRRDVEDGTEETLARELTLPRRR
jgi:hypothetical protein